MTVYSGSSSHGQGHQTTFAQIVADELEIPYEDIEVVQGDTGTVQFGIGTFGSRSMAVGGVSMKLSLDKIVTKATKIAAHLLEANEEDVEFKEAKFSVKGAPDRVTSWADVALMAHLAHNYPAGWSRAWKRRHSTIRRTSPGRSARTSPWSRSMPRRGASICNAMSRWTTAVG